MQNQNMNLVLSTDAKPRLKWTPELHQRFVDAVNQLGGPAKATPKSLMRVIGIPGLTLYHLKSHLQKYRLAKNQHSNATCSDHIHEVILDEDQGIQRSGKQELSQEVDDGSKNELINESSGIAEALQMQMEVQRKLHEQIEVQRHLQLRIEAQGKYLQSVLNKAKETLSNYSSSFMGIELAKAELSQLVSMVNSGYPSSSISELTETGDSSLRVTETNRTNGTVCSMDSSLTSADTQQKNKTVRNSRSIVAFLELPSTDIQSGEATKDCDSKQKKENSNAGSTRSGEDQPWIKRSKTGEEQRKSRLMIGFDLNRQYQNEMESGSRVIDLNSVDIS